MIALYFLLSALIALAAAFARQRRTVKRLGAAFYLVQLSLVAHIVAEGYGEVSSQFFRFDAAGTLFFALLTIVSAFVFVHSCVYLRDNPIKEYRLYFTLLMLLTTAITGVYFARNIAVTWIFLEATTLCAAGIVYHRRTAQALEATWKYIFVCSVGIATAYLGILLLSSLGDGSLRYEELARSVGGGNPLYLKIAFLLILCGYSCKMEIFPLYTIGVDANFAAPAPASALISTGLVNAGFLAVFRVYRIMEQTEAIGWVRNVLLLTGILSLAVGALFLRRTNNYKRFLSYSTVENMGIAAIGLGIGLYDGVMGPGTGTFAIIAFTTLMGFDLRTANGNGKVLNLASNYASLFTYLMNGLVVFHIGIPCAISNILGNLLGSHFALKKGARFIRPMMLVVLVLLLGKLISDAVL